MKRGDLPRAPVRGWLPGFESPLHWSLAMWPWTSDLIFVCQVPLIEGFKELNTVSGIQWVLNESHFLIWQLKDHRSAWHPQKGRRESPQGGNIWFSCEDTVGNCERGKCQSPQLEIELELLSSLQSKTDTDNIWKGKILEEINFVVHHLTPGYCFERAITIGLSGDHLLVFPASVQTREDSGCSSGWERTMETPTAMSMPYTVGWLAEFLTLAPFSPATFCQRWTYGTALTDEM